MAGVERFEPEIGVGVAKLPPGPPLPPVRLGKKAIPGAPCRRVSPGCSRKARRTSRAIILRMGLTFNPFRSRLRIARM
jgi:hypothetical protein